MAEKKKERHCQSFSSCSSSGHTQEYKIFSFNDNMHMLVDGVAMGFLLRPPLANIFISFHEKRVFHELNMNVRPTVHYRYVDDTFAIFNTPASCTDFLIRLNSLHPALKFTFETGQSNVLPFLDVLVEKTDDGFLMTISTARLLSLGRTHSGTPLAQRATRLPL